MTRARRLARAGAVLAAVALLVPVGVGPAGARTANRASHKAYPVAVTVEDVSPSTPTPTKQHTTLTITLTLRSTTEQTYPAVSVIGERGEPLGSQEALNNVLANPAAPASGGLPIPSRPAVKVDQLGNQPVTVTFTTSTSTIDDGKGICLCHRGAVYPLFFSVHTVANGVDQLLGVTATYLPSFDPKDFTPVAPNRVSWIWPLLDRPHRLTQDTVFTDDQLATEVAPDGRLSRALDVLAELPDKIPMTLLVDPDLLDELEVMADTSTPYTVMTKDGKTVPGKGQALAASWLARLHNILTESPQVQVELTPYGDPDFESLTARGLTWSDTMPAPMAARVRKALAGHPVSGNLAWPATGAISRPTLRRLARQDVSTVVLTSAAVRTGAAAGAIGPGLARLRVGPNRDVAAALITSAIERPVARAISEGGQGSAALPELLAQLAIRPAQDAEHEHQVTITAPRYVDPDVTASVRTIEETSSSVFARPMSLAAAVGDDLMPNTISRLGPVPASATGQAFETMTAAAEATAALPTIRSLLDTAVTHDAAAISFQQSLSVAIQRAASAAWRFHENATPRRRFANQLSTTIDDTTSGVRIVQSAHTYTFGSSTAPLPITVDNGLPYPVEIRISIVTNPPGVLGFRTKNIGTQSVEATQKRTFNIPTTIEHSGRIRIEARLHTGNGLPLDTPQIEMTVRSTALGLIGVVITIVAGVILVLALLWRLVRRLRHRRATGGSPPAVSRLPEPEPVG